MLDFMEIIQHGYVETVMETAELVILEQIQTVRVVMLEDSYIKVLVYKLVLQEHMDLMEFVILVIKNVKAVQDQMIINVFLVNQDIS